jgi:hypothetical protein
VNVALYDMLLRVRPTQVVQTEEEREKERREQREEEERRVNEEVREKREKEREEEGLEPTQVVPKTSSQLVLLPGRLRLKKAY